MTTRAETGKDSSRLEWITFIVVVVIHLILAWVVMVNWGLVKTDSIARTANAYYVFWSRDPHLAAIGFIWTPLMSVLQLPLVLWRPLAATGYSGAIVSVICGGMNAVLLLKIFRQLGVGTRASILLLIAYSLHPMVFYYVSNGMTESIFITCSLIATYCLLLLKPVPRPQLYVGTIMGLAVSGAFLVRYEGVVLAGVMILCMVIRYIEFRVESTDLKTVETQKVFRDRMLATAIQVAVIPFAVCVLWMFSNWMIMGSPFYFMMGDYSNTAQMMADPTQQGNTGRQSIGLILSRLASLSPAYLILIPVLAVWAIAARTALPIVLILFWSTAMGFQAAFSMAGMATNEGRYLMTIIPGATIFAAFLVGRSSGKARLLVQIPVFALMLASPVMGYYGLHTRLHVDDYAFVRAMDVMGKPDEWTGNFVNYNYKLVDELNHLDGLVLMDTFMNNPYYLKMDDPKKAVVTSDQDFRVILENPRRHVQYILTTEPIQLGVLDQTNVRWPGLYEGKESWAQLVGEYPPASGSIRRLYKVLR